MVVAVCTAICFAMFPFFALSNLVMVYLLGTLIVAARGQRGPAALSSALGVLCFDFFFVQPRFSFSVSDAQYLLTFAVMFAAAMVISHLTIRLRSEAESARQGQLRTEMMHAFTEELINAHGEEAVLRLATARIGETFGSAVIALFPGLEGRLEVKATSEGATATSDKERGIAQWVYDTGQPAGLGTDSLPVGDALYIPILGAQGPMGVLAATPRDPGKKLRPEQRKLLDSFAHQMGMALELDRFQKSSRKAEVEVEAERLRSSLLSSVSHDLRTPLAVVVGTADTLAQSWKDLDPAKVQEFIENIRFEAEHLSLLVQNLLEVTRLESGAVKVRKELYPLEEVLGIALERMRIPLKNREVKVNMAADLPPVPMDGLLMGQVFVNLLENAVRHTPVGTPLDIWAGVEGKSVRVAVADRGTGLQQDELERVFDKFYRSPSSRGAGLGLAICRAIITVHSGTICACNRPGGGAIFCFTLPLENNNHGS
jgi:two-component system sensor histidine kinase KdpD